MVQILFCPQNNENRMSGNYNHNFCFLKFCSQKPGMKSCMDQSKGKTYAYHLQELNYDYEEYGDVFYDHVVAEAEANAARAAEHYNNKIMLETQTRPQQKRGLRTVMMCGL